MVDKIEETIRRYYALVLTVIGIMFAMVAAVYAVTKPMQDDVAEIKADIRELRAISSGNFQRLEDFRVRTESNRYTSQDAERDQERVWDSINRLEKLHEQNRQ